MVNLRRALKYFHYEQWHWSLRMVLLFQGPRLDFKETEQELEDLNEEARLQLKEDLSRTFTQRTTRIISSSQITGILVTFQGSIFIGLLFAERTEDRQDVLRVLVIASSVLIWSLISGLQYLVLFMDWNPVTRSKKNLDFAHDFHDLKEFVVNRNAKSTMISICQTVSGLLTIVTLYMLVGLAS